jgi:hypothetical protein
MICRHTYPADPSEMATVSPRRHSAAQPGADTSSNLARRLLRHLRTWKPLPGKSTYGAAQPRDELPPLHLRPPEMDIPPTLLAIVDEVIE